MDQNKMRVVLNEFFYQYRSVRLARHEMLLRAGEEPRGIYYLEKGHVRQYDISGKSGNELTTHIYGPGSFFPLAWGLNVVPNRYFYQTIENAEMWLAPATEVEKFLKKNPEILFSLTKRLLAGLNGLADRLPYYAFGDAYVRVLAELLYLARHFGVRAGKQVLIEEHFTHQNLADLTGSVRETISVAMERMKASHLISYHGQKICIEDIDELEAELLRRL